MLQSPAPLLSLGVASLPARAVGNESFPTVVPPTPVLFLGARFGHIICIPICSKTTDLEHGIRAPWNSTSFTGRPMTQQPEGQHGRNHQQGSPK